MSEAEIAAAPRSAARVIFFELRMTYPLSGIGLMTHLL
jgi:hypothetical protein